MYIDTPCGVKPRYPYFLNVEHNSLKPLLFEGVVGTGCLRPPSPDKMAMTPREWRSLWDALPAALRVPLESMDASDPEVVAELAPTPEDLAAFVAMLCPASDAEELITLAIRLGAVVEAASAPADREQLRVALLSEKAMASELVGLRKKRRVSAGPGNEDAPDAVRPPPPAATRWRRTRLGKELQAAETPTARKDANDKEKSRWVQELAAIVQACGMPAAERATRSMDPERALARLGKGLRARTIRKRVRAWQKLAAWLRKAKGKEYPFDAVDVVDYANDRFDEPAGPGVFEALKASIKFLEGVGGVPAEEQLQGDSWLKAQLDDMEKKASQGGARRKAPRPFASMIVSLEKLVGDTTERRYVRAFAWHRLVMTWGALRLDDTMGMPPALMTMGERGLHAVLVETKTTGEDKKVRKADVWISMHAWLANGQWLVQGFELWAEMAFQRDFFLPMPDPELEGVVQMKAEYHQVSAFSRAMLNEIKVEHVVIGVEKGESLLFPAACLFWTEHSARAWLPSACVSAGFPPEWVNTLAWSHLQSEEYVRTKRQRTERMQKAVAEKCRHGAGASDFLDEASLSEELRLHVAEGRHPRDDRLAVAGAPDGELARSRRWGRSSRHAQHDGQHAGLCRRHGRQPRARGRHQGDRGGRKGSRRDRRGDRRRRSGGEPLRERGRLQRL